MGKQDADPVELGLRLVRQEEHGLLPQVDSELAVIENTLQ